jgi:hypothetical protein
MGMTGTRPIGDAPHQVEQQAATNMGEPSVTSRAQNHAQNDEPRTISRRGIVRSGATLAWAVPAITMATAVPAFAGSSCCDLYADGHAAWRSGELNYGDITLDIRNDCSGELTGLTVTLTVCDVDDVTYSGHTPSGWVPLGKPNKKLDADGQGCYSLTYTSPATLAGNADLTPTFTFKTTAYAGNGEHRPAGNILVHVTAGDCTAQDTDIVLPKVG